MDVKKTMHRLREKHILGKTILAVFALCAWVVPSHAQSVMQKATQYVYWTNNNNGSIGRATTTGTGVDQSFIGSQTGGSGGALE